MRKRELVSESKITNQRFELWFWSQSDSVLLFSSTLGKKGRKRRKEKGRKEGNKGEREGWGITFFHFEHPMHLAIIRKGILSKSLLIYKYFIAIIIFYITFKKSVYICNFRYRYI